MSGCETRTVTPTKRMPRKIRKLTAPPRPKPYATSIALRATTVNTSSCTARNLPDPATGVAHRLPGRAEESAHGVARGSRAAGLVQGPIHPLAYVTPVG